MRVPLARRSAIAIVARKSVGGTRDAQWSLREVDRARRRGRRHLAGRASGSRGGAQLRTRGVSGGAAVPGSAAGRHRVHRGRPVGSGFRRAQGKPPLGWRGGRRTRASWRGRTCIWGWRACRWPTPTRRCSGSPRHRCGTRRCGWIRREFPRDVLELWAEARNLGMLLVDSEPSGAEVSIDEVVWGRSPVGVAGLRPGEYRVTLAHAGYAGVSRVLSWPPGGPSACSSRWFRRRARQTHGLGGQRRLPASRTASRRRAVFRRRGSGAGACERVADSGPVPGRYDEEERPVVVADAAAFWV